MSINLHAVHSGMNNGGQPPVRVEIDYQLGSTATTFIVTETTHNKVTSTDDEVIIKTRMGIAELEEMVKTLKMILKNEDPY